MHGPIYIRVPSVYLRYAKTVVPIGVFLYFGLFIYFGFLGFPKREKSDVKGTKCIKCTVH